MSAKLSDEDKKKVLDLIELISKVIGKESPIVVANACLKIIQASCLLGGGK